VSAQSIQRRADSDAQQPFRARTAIAFESQEWIHGQAFFLQDNFVITYSGTELLASGMPSTAEAIMRKQNSEVALFQAIHDPRFTRKLAIGPRKR
jgi:hypothetical protein